MRLGAVTLERTESLLRSKSVLNLTFRRRTDAKWKFVEGALSTINIKGLATKILRKRENFRSKITACFTARVCVENRKRSPMLHSQGVPQRNYFSTRGHVNYLISKTLYTVLIERSNQKRYDL